MIGAIGMLLWDSVMVVRKVRVRVSVERVGVRKAGGKMGRVGWEVVVRASERGIVETGSRMERVVIMVRVPSFGMGPGGGFAVLVFCDLEPDELVMGVSMGRYMVETMVIQDVEFVSSVGRLEITTGVCGGGVSGPIARIDGGTMRVANVVFAELMGTATLPAV